MTKVYPNAIASSALVANTAHTTSSSSSSSSKLSSASSEGHGNGAGGGAGVFTVWKKSLLFNCDGFTVLDAKGNLAFRVDNYGSAAHEVLLMDASGKPLQTIRRKRFSISVNWLMYDGDKSTNPILSARKHVSLVSNARSCLAHVSTTTTTLGSRLVYQIEGSYTHTDAAPSTIPIGSVSQKSDARRLPRWERPLAWTCSV